MEQVFVRDMILDEQLANVLASATKSRRLGEGKIISAKIISAKADVDVESAKLLREAADILDS